MALNIRPQVLRVARRRQKHRFARLHYSHSVSSLVILRYRQSHEFFKPPQLDSHNTITNKIFSIKKMEECCTLSHVFCICVYFILRDCIVFKLFNLEVSICDDIYCIETSSTHTKSDAHNEVSSGLLSLNFSI